MNFNGTKSIRKRDQEAEIYFSHEKKNREKGIIKKK